MRSNAGKANKEGDVDRVSLRLPVNTLVWLGTKEFGRSNLPVTHQEGISARLQQGSRIDSRLPSHDTS